MDKLQRKIHGCEKCRKSTRVVSVEIRMRWLDLQQPSNELTHFNSDVMDKERTK